MPTFQNKYRIESARLRSWDYSWPGWYYVTICTKDMKFFLGKAANEIICLSPLGEVAEKCWTAIPNHFKHVELDEYRVMPNHIHGVLVVNEFKDCTRRDDCVNRSPEPQPSIGSASAEPLKLHMMSKISPKPGSLGTILHSFKAAVTFECRGRGLGPFAWQPRFFDHIIRNDADLHRIRQYIRNNTLQWVLDWESSEYLKSNPLCRDVACYVSTHVSHTK